MDALVADQANILLLMSVQASLHIAREAKLLHNKSCHCLWLEVVVLHDAWSTYKYVVKKQCSFFNHPLVVTKKQKKRSYMKCSDLVVW